ncbi:MAG: glycosyltransferase [Deltaproteobacteria bacterium]|nr:glycosyltransferase [Deltaproteobacteria bacterium]
MKRSYEHRVPRRGTAQNRSVMSKKTPFTACLITFNEEGNIEAALESLGFADEIIVIDSHSTDRTRELALGFRGCSRYGREVEPCVIEKDWPGHVEQKNFAIRHSMTGFYALMRMNEFLPGCARKSNQCLAWIHLNLTGIQCRGRLTIWDAGFLKGVGILIASCVCFGKTEGAGAASTRMIT